MNLSSIVLFCTGHGVHGVRSALDWTLDAGCKNGIVSFPNSTKLALGNVLFTLLSLAARFNCSWLATVGKVMDFWYPPKKHRKQFELHFIS
jgi:hypothetical protein